MKKIHAMVWQFAGLFLLPGAAMAQTRELSLQQALQLAAKGNRPLQVRHLETRKSEEAIKEAKSYLLPSVSLDAGYRIYGERPAFFLRDEGASPTLKDVKVGGRFVMDGTVSAQYPLVNHGIKSQVRMSGITAEIQKQETRNTAEELALEISRLYLTVLVSREQRKLLEQSLHRNERALKDSRSLFLQGKNLKTDTLSNYISVQNLHAAISALDNDIEVMSVQMKQLMGITDSSRLLLTDSFTAPEPAAIMYSAGEGYAAAMEHRKDLKIQSLRVDQQKEQLEGVKAAFRPQLWAVAQYQVQNQTDDFKFRDLGFPRTSFAGIRFSMPLFTGHRQQYKSKQASMSVQQEEVAAEELKNKVRTELISLEARMQEARNQWEIQQQNVEAAQINYTMMNDRYRYGLGNRLELTDAELALTRAKINHLQAIYSIRLIELQWKKALGILQLD